MQEESISDHPNLAPIGSLMVPESTPQFFELLRHAQSNEAATRSVAAACQLKAGGQLDLRFTCVGDLANVALPAPGAGARADNLWRTTCFELFLMGESGADYTEVNLSPSTDWAIYSFEGYRHHQTINSGATVLATNSRRDGDTLTFKAHIFIPGLNAPNRSKYRIGLSAIIENKWGAKSFWALAHAPGAPDFHYEESFIGTLAEDKTL